MLSDRIHIPSITSLSYSLEHADYSTTLTIRPDSFFVPTPYSSRLLLRPDSFFVQLLLRPTPSSSNSFFVQLLLRSTPFLIHNINPSLWNTAMTYGLVRIRKEEIELDDKPSYANAATLQLHILGIHLRPQGSLRLSSPWHWCRHSHPGIVVELLLCESKLTPLSWLCIVLISIFSTFYLAPQLPQITDASSSPTTKLCACPLKRTISWACQLKGTRLWACKLKILGLGWILDDVSHPITGASCKPRLSESPLLSTLKLTLQPLHSISLLSTPQLLLNPIPYNASKPPNTNAMSIRVIHLSFYNSSPWPFTCSFYVMTQRGIELL